MTRSSSLPQRAARARRRVCLVVEQYPVPSQTFIHRLAQALVDHAGVELTILAVDAVDAEQIPHVARGQIRYLAAVGKRSRVARYLASLRILIQRFVQRPLSTLRTLDILRFGRDAALLRILRARWLLDQLESDVVVHAQFLNVGFVVAAARSCGPSMPNFMLASARGADTTRHERPTQQQMSLLERQNVTVLPVADHLADRLIERGYDPCRIEKVVSGLDTRTYPFRLPSSRPPPFPVRVLFVGRLVEKKGLRIALEVVSRTTVEGRARLRIVGDGPLMPHLVRTAGRYGIDEHTQFLGTLPQSQVVAEMLSAHVLLVPSLRARDGDEEGLPNVIKEGMACGVIVVASDHGGAPELVKPGATGYLFRQGDVESAATTLSRCIAEREQWDRIARAARTAVEEQYGIEVMLRSLLSAYRLSPRSGQGNDQQVPA